MSIVHLTPWQRRGLRGQLRRADDASYYRRLLFLPRRRGRGADFEEFLGEIHWYYRGRHVALLLDEDSSHTAGRSRDRADELGIELLWLPKRSPHLNPLEHLWRHGKERVSANHQYGSVEEHVNQFTAYLAGLSPQEALRKAGVLSEDFWID